MCCRYWTDESPELRAIVEEMNHSILMDRWQKKAKIKTYGEICPTDVVPVIAPKKDGSRAVYPMKWGFSGKTLLLNARTETAAQKPMFREAWKRHRCIVPASWYFEWEHITVDDGKKHTGEKYRIRPKDLSVTWGSALTCLCGLYRIEEGLPVFVVLTREPSRELTFLHDRMPLILPEELTEEWIRPDGNPEKLLSLALTEMIYEPQRP